MVAPTIPHAQQVQMDHDNQLVEKQRASQAAGFAQSMAMLDLQREQAQKSEAIAALSNVMKNAHDSAMLVINNAKG